MTLSSKTRRIVLICATCVIVLCVCWMFFFSGSSELKDVCNILNKYGYTFYEDDLLVAYDNADTTIRSTLESKNIDDAISASKSSGFSSDVDKRGGVTLIMAAKGADNILLYMLDGTPELCFIETDSGEIKPIGE